VIEHRSGVSIFDPEHFLLCLVSLSVCSSGKFSCSFISPQRCGNFMHVGNIIFLCRAGWASDDTGPSRWSFSWPFSRCLSWYFWNFPWRFFCSFYWAFQKSSVACFYQGRSRAPDPDPISRVVGLFASRYYVCGYLHIDTCVLLLVCFTCVSRLDHLCMASMNLYIFVYGTCNEFMCMACMNLYVFLCILQLSKQ
jgi:hypothetical protein